MKENKLPILLVAVCIFSCKQKNTIVSQTNATVSTVSVKTAEQVSTENTAACKYDLAHPTRHWSLPDPLVEVSGNAWINENHLLLIEDLNPDLYLIKSTTIKQHWRKLSPFIPPKKKKPTSKM